MTEKTTIDKIKKSIDSVNSKAGYGVFSFEVVGNTVYLNRFYPNGTIRYWIVNDLQSMLDDLNSVFYFV